MLHRIQIAQRNPVERLALVGGKLDQLVLSRLIGRPAAARSQQSPIRPSGLYAIGHDDRDPAVRVA
jgi:hypothetical protein